MPRITLSEFCMAIQNLEGYFPPCTQYPSGSPAYHNNNPGNIKCDEVMHRLASGKNGPFCVFKDYATGFNALEDNIIKILQGKATEYGYYPEMTLLEFFAHRDPPPENDPVACAKNVAAFLNVSPAFELKDLVIA